MLIYTLSDRFRFSLEAIFFSFIKYIYDIKFQKRKENYIRL
jgi:hypothetical protein